MAKTIFKKRENGDVPEDGAKVYLRDGYGSGVKYFVCELTKGFCLIADNKRDFNDGRGFIHHISDIERYQIFS